MKRKAKFLFICCCVISALSSTMSCDDGLDVTQEYPFTVEAMPAQDEVAYGETVELRLSIVEDGGFDGTVYTLRYFQTDGEGRLEMEDGMVMKPNDRAGQKGVPPVLYLFERRRRAVNRPVRREQLGRRGEADVRLQRRRRG